MTAPDARRLAWRALMSWEQGEVPLLDQALRVAGADRGRDGALARELALGAVRYRRLYDALAAPHLRRGEQPLPLLVTLRLLAHQLFALDRIPAHAAVSRSVGCLGGAERGLRGVANAVGRRLAEIRLDERDPGRPGPLGRIPPERIPERLAVRHSLPDELVADLAAVMPRDADQALAALNHVPPLCTRTRPGRELADHPAMIRRDGSWIWWSEAQPALSGPVATGDAVVQDRAQGELMEVADPAPGSLVVDCCAAPGGKARWLRDRGCRVVAGEIALSKFTRLIGGPVPLRAVLRQDARSPALAAGAFDLVVVDAPCSNSGVLARRPEARWRYAPAQLSGLAQLQADILRAASGLVAPRGRLLYSTCSLSPVENTVWREALPGWEPLAEHLRWPDAWGGGGYAVLLRQPTPASGT